jgi:hypothetical protein
MLNNYLKYFTSKSEKGILFEYEFKVSPFNQVVRSVRPMSVSVRSAARNQIGQMLNVGFIEMSDSAYLNTLIIVAKDG